MRAAPKTASKELFAYNDGEVGKLKRRNNRIGSTYKGRNFEKETIKKE